mmetsp:Transcript_7121/g.18015  ORF Transcript_7121/g.18015 Transcript_7121/m.18015 type:complete len:174 (+) Transcript_7121:225-746(+)
MGCGGSSEVKIVGAEEEEEEKPQKSSRRQGALDMNHGEIKRFHDLVSSIDVNHDDHVSRKEFVDTLDLKPKPMARRLFEVMVVEHTGQEHKKGGSGENTQPLHVAEFFVGIFHFGTRTDKHVHEDFFNIYCTHSISHHGKTRKVMDNTDLHTMIRDIMGEAYLKGMHLSRVFI